VRFVVVLPPGRVRPLSPFSPLIYGEFQCARTIRESDEAATAGCCRKIERKARAGRRYKAITQPKTRRYVI